MQHNPELISTVRVPGEIKPLFDNAQKVVGEYFKKLKHDPTHGSITIGDERYVLVRAAALSIDFIDTIKKLYADRGEREANIIGNNFLFDISHVIGINDATSFHQKMHLKEPLARLSAGPIHFAYSGWASVEILPQSNPTPDENYFLIYHHPYSFEADSWIHSGRKADFPVCIMNSGYSSGWCEASFGQPLTAVEISCKAKGDKHCTFIMAPPHKIKEHVKMYFSEIQEHGQIKKYDIPAFFERKNVEESLQMAKIKAEESARLKMEFLINLSHEIRTPLNAMLGYVDLLLDDSPYKKHAEYLKTIKESGNLLHSLVNEMLDLSKIESGQLIIASVPCSIKEILNQTEHNARGLIHHYSKKITLTKKLNGISDIYTDPVRLQQVFNNLISNAVKFTENGFIEFGIEKTENKMIYFFVRDSGIGISEKDGKKIFDVFNQVNNTFTRKYDGTGLGLNISKKLVEILGGRIWVKSKFGQGSTFYFTIPFKGIKENEKFKEINVPKEMIPGKTLVMLVEDNLTNQNLMKIILERSGFEVVKANNGKEAIELFRCNKKIDVIVMDIQMPIMDGLSATKSIRELENKNPFKRVPIIALTAHALKEDMQNCLNAGCDSYLTKPIDIKDLIRQIKTYLEKK